MRVLTVGAEWLEVFGTITLALGESSMRPPYEVEPRCPRCDRASDGYCSKSCEDLHEREKAIRDLRGLLREVMSAKLCRANALDQLEQRVAKLRINTKHLAAA